MHYRVLTIFGKHVVVFIFKKSLIISLSSNEEDPENLTKEELLVEYEKLRSEINNLTEVKKWGLVWKDQPQDVIDNFVESSFPILTPVSKVKSKYKGLPTNYLIQGDNYNSLSVLNYTHREKIDMIYIDPPYNTGGSMMYNNDFPSQDARYRRSFERPDTGKASGKRLFHQCRPK